MTDILIALATLDLGHLLVGAGVAGDPTILADGGSSDSSSPSAFGLIPFVAGPAVFFMVYLGIYRYYRNTDKSHDFEHETRVEPSDLRSYDDYAGENNRQRSREMADRNDGQTRQRVRRFDMP